MLELHHRDIKQKEDGVIDFLSGGWSMKKIWAEVEKCDILCCNCYRKKHTKIIDGQRVNIDL